MRKETKSKLTCIQDHINRNYKRWFKTYSGLEGVHVGLKKINGQPIHNCYSVVFHVNRKSHTAKKKVPKFLYVRLNARNTIQVPTDVIEAGKLKLNGIKLGDCAQNVKSTVTGTIFFYFTSSSGTYLCSNMHVLGANLLKRGQLNYDVRKGDKPQVIDFFDEHFASTADLLKGRFGGVDLAFARIRNPLVPTIIEKEIKSIGPVKGFFDLTLSNIDRVQLSFFGCTTGFRNCNAIRLGAIKKTSFENVFITNLIKLERCTADGDSGAPLFDEKNRIVGIIVGRDNENSYAIPIHDVVEFFQTSKL